MTDRSETMVEIASGQIAKMAKTGIVAAKNWTYNNIVSSFAFAISCIRWHDDIK